MCIRLPAFVFALPELWWRQKSLKILFPIFLVDPGDCVNQGLSANQNLGSGITWRLRERTFLDPFLDPVSCVVTELQNSTHLEKSFTSTLTARDWSLANCLSFTFFVFYLVIHFTDFRPPLSVSVWTGVNFERVWIMEANERMTVIKQGLLFFVLYQERIILSCSNMVRVWDLSHPYTFLARP